jgi:hypothetical protein
MILLSINLTPNIWILFTGNECKHHQTANEINLETVVWTNNESIIPVDFRIYDIDPDWKSEK